MASTTESGYGHTLSPKSLDLGRDTFFFLNLSTRAQLYLGVNQKFTPVSSATIHHWIEIMSPSSGSQHPFVLCPVTVLSAGIMSYYVEPSGPFIAPESTELIPPGNYGWYPGRDCIYKGYPELTEVRSRLFTFEERMEEESEHSSDFSTYEVPRAVETVVAVARDKNRCRFTGLEGDNVVAWIIPPLVAWETDDRGDREGFDKTPFIAAANVLTMQSELRFHLHNNHFTVDVDDGYRILVLRGMGDVQGSLPSHLPPHLERDAATDHFLRLHCRYSLHLMLRGGDIKEVYPNGVILNMMNQLGVDYNGNEDRDEMDMVPLEDERWQTELGQAILANVLKARLDDDDDDDDDRSNSRPNSPGGQAELTESKEPFSGDESPHTPSSLGFYEVASDSCEPEWPTAHPLPLFTDLERFPVNLDPWGPPESCL